MKFLILSLALVAAVMADVNELGGGYNYDAPAVSHNHGAVIEGGDFGGEGGYSSSVPSNTYIPPAAPANTYIPPAAAAPANTYIPPAASEESASFADDGYRYKTHRRRIYRHRF